MSSSPNPIQRWSTEDVPQGQRFDYYAEALTTSIDAMHVASRRIGSFNAEITSAALGPISVIRGIGSTHRCLRDARDVSRSSEHCFHLIINSAPWRLTHRNRLRMRAGDAVLLDSKFGHDLLLDTFNIVHLKLPDTWMRQWLPRPDVLAGRVVRFDSGWGRALVAFAAQLSPEFVIGSPLPSPVVADQVGALLSLVANEMSHAVLVQNRTQADLRDRIEQCLGQRCDEQGLTATDVADSLRISPRTLHRALASYGLTFGRSLVGARVALALRMLESPKFDRLTTAEVGRRAGFSDASHFARVLRRELGRSPRNLRQRRQL